MHQLELISPAKINLYLDIIGKRNDGYHIIETIFEKIDLFDKIQFKSSQAGIRISTNLPDLPTDGTNLVYKAAALFVQRFKIEEGVDIYVDKKIPIAAGLGGGSSNAATTLLGLRKFWNLNIKDAELLELAKTLGADVPFFIFNSSFASGHSRGDEVLPIRSSLSMWHLVVSPPIKVLTKNMYNEATLNLTEKKRDVKILIRAIEDGNFSVLKKQLYNALEHIAVKKVTEIIWVKEFFTKMGHDAVMVSGSGPSVFALTTERKEAVDLKTKLEEMLASKGARQGWKIFVAKTAGNINNKEHEF